MITVYSTRNCQQCKATMRALDARRMVYSTVYVDENDQAAAFARSLGHTQAPVVVIDGYKHWSGFRPDLIDEAANTIHLDGFQWFQGGHFVTPCSCGHESWGDDPGDSTLAHNEHVDESIRDEARR